MSEDQTEFRLALSLIINDEGLAPRGSLFGLDKVRGVIRVPVWRVDDEGYRQPAVLTVRPARVKAKIKALQ